MIDGLATATIVASTRIMKKPTRSAHSACQGLSGDAVGKIGSPRRLDVIAAPRPAHDTARPAP